MPMHERAHAHQNNKNLLTFILETLIILEPFFPHFLFLGGNPVCKYFGLQT